MTDFTRSFQKTVARFESLSPSSKEDYRRAAKACRRIILDEADNISPVEWEKMARVAAQQTK